MIRTYFLQALRNIRRNRMISFVNIFGLSVSLTLAIHLIVYVKFELSYDKFHVNHARIYRLLSGINKPGEDPEIYAISQGQFAREIKNIPEVEHYVRLYYKSNSDLEYGNRRFTGNRLVYADTAFFDMFSFKLIEGNKSEILKDPNSIILTKSTALKIFNSLDITGKPVKCRDMDLVVGGIIEDIPSNSHIKFDMVCSTDKPYIRNTVEKSGLEFHSYILLRNNVNHNVALQKITEEYGKHLSGFWMKSDRNNDFTYYGVTQKIEDIELHSPDNIIWNVPRGNLKDIWLATGLICFILVIAVLNFINLETANAHSRLKEIAVNKINGASRFNLVRQFIGEKVFTSVVSGGFALLFLTSFSWMVVNRFTGKNIPETLIFNPWILGGLLFLCVMIGIIAGIYPSIYVSRFSVSRVLTGSFSKGMRTSSLIKTLVFSQLAIVIILVSGLLIFYWQMAYIRDKDLGFEKEYVVAVENLREVAFRNYPTIKQELMHSGFFDNVCLAQGINVEDFSGQSAAAVGTGAERSPVYHTRTTHGFVKTFKLDIVEGRDFDSSMIADKKNYIINETAARILGFEGDPIGREIAINDTGLVIGVVRDFNFASLHNSIEPLVITLNDRVSGYIFVRLKSAHFQEGLDLISRTIKTRDPLYSFEYKFVDDVFDSMYNQENKMNKILSLCTYISILLAFMGLTALTSFTILRRIKEIGIRKINGATINEVLVLLNSDYIKLIAFAFLIGVPLSWVVMKTWLDGFAFRIELRWWFFAVSGLFVLAITVVSVSLISWKAANRNPVEALRYE